ncbi:hypothetical protein GCM10011344_04720 [Dokdonia pacifica]|uniref:DUF6249 domain-containing protein n=1 Tax=Dokdonia pacifica TaxID=1627892 RepID=A0A238ZM12_9FLAO|nr:DUF6249 domain-containing protein [Dokdonia pacifica]GGG07252.1 hypothetical protein GCM10011344_04720 [Dokdonia pacifica]SNR84212.1 hypothetical protein SAMN06265376_103333 [Dokdonia pacifica]
MGGEIIIFLCIFGSIFGIAYLHYSTRNKERLALIEKGMDAGIFKQSRETPPIWKILVLNIALLLMGIGTGILIALMLQETVGYNDALYPGIIFLMAGTGLLAGFFLTRKLVK